MEYIRILLFWWTVLDAVITTDMYNRSLTLLEQKRPAYRDYAPTEEEGAELMSSLVHSANLCRCKAGVTLVYRRTGSAEINPGSFASRSSKLITFRFGQITQPYYAWNGFWGTGVEMQRCTSSPQQEPCPTYTATKSMTSCFILYDFDMREICSDLDEEWRKHSRRTGWRTLFSAAEAPVT